MRCGKTMEKLNSCLNLLSQLSYYVSDRLEYLYRVLTLIHSHLLGDFMLKSQNLTLTDVFCSRA